jgi:LysR family transcriptional regulator for bpeEF and oprC
LDRIDLFRIFARVVECASFTRAADTLGLPRSSVSAAVQELESLAKSVSRNGCGLRYRPN